MPKGRKREELRRPAAGQSISAAGHLRMVTTTRTTPIMTIPTNQQLLPHRQIHRKRQLRVTVATIAPSNHAQNVDVARQSATRSFHVDLALPEGHR